MQHVEPWPVQFGLRSILLTVAIAAFVLSLWQSLGVFGFTWAVFVAIQVIIVRCLAVDVREHEGPRRKALLRFATGVIGIVLAFQLMMALALIAASAATLFFRGHGAGNPILQ